MESRIDITPYLEARMLLIGKAIEESEVYSEDYKAGARMAFRRVLVELGDLEDMGKEEVE